MRLLNSIKPGEIHDLAKKVKPDAKASTRNRHVIVPCRAVINFAAERGLCPHIRVKGFKEAKVIRQAVDREWIDKFMAHAPHRHLGLLALFMFMTGARVSEAVQLTPDDIDLNQSPGYAWQDQERQSARLSPYARACGSLRSLPPKRVADGSWRVFGYMTRNAPARAWDDTIKRAKMPYAFGMRPDGTGSRREMIVRSGKDTKTTTDLGGLENASSLLIAPVVHSEKLDDVAEGVFGASGNSQDQASSDTNLTHTYNPKVAQPEKVKQNQ